MKKIGICTFYNNNNYGSYLQAYALKSYLKRVGYDAYIIDFADCSKAWNKKLRYKTIWSRVKCLLSNPKLLIETVKAKFISRQQSTICSNSLVEKFRYFKNDYLKPYTENFIEDKFDAFIVGSDQVWKVSMPGLHFVFFLRFCTPNKRISYAASLGSETIPSYNKKDLFKCLKEFKAISVRESSAVTLLDDMGKGVPATLVLDPVLLIGNNFWQESITPIAKAKYVFMYFLDPVLENEKLIANLLSKYSDCRIYMIYTGVRLQTIANVDYIEPSPLEFVSYINSAELVITDSFHGSAFSILLNKEFYILPRNYKIYAGQSTRIFSLLKLFGCEDRLIYDSKTIKSIRSIDWSSINIKMNEMQIISSDYLHNAIEA